MVCQGRGRASGCHDQDMLLGDLRSDITHEQWPVRTLRFVAAHAASHSQVAWPVAFTCVANARPALEQMVALRLDPVWMRHTPGPGAASHWRPVALCAGLLATGQGAAETGAWISAGTK